MPPGILHRYGLKGSQRGNHHQTSRQPIQGTIDSSRRASHVYPRTCSWECSRLVLITCVVLCPELSVSASSVTSGSTSLGGHANWVLAGKRRQGSR
eukprot:2331279-Amphidinium_carterae.1